MIKKLVYFGLLLSCASIQSNVIPLASNNVSEYLQNHVTFIRFYADWCPHSKKFEPTWQRFAQMKESSDLHVAEIDCSIDPLLCSDHDIFGYPTVKLFVHGSGARYEGPRSIESLEAFYQEKLAEDANFGDGVATKATIVELTIDNFAQFASKDFMFVVFHAPWCSHCKLLLPVFQELAKEMSNTDGLTFATVDCTIQNHLCTKYAIKGYPTLIWFENAYEKDRYTAARDVTTMRNYVEQKIEDARPVPTETPPVQEESEQTIDGPSMVSDDAMKYRIELPVDYEANVLNAKTFTQGVSFEGYAFVNFGAPWCSHCQKLAPIWDRLAQKFSQIEDIRISRVDCTANEALCRDYGIRAFPTLLLFRYGETRVEYNGVKDFDSLYQFFVGQLEYFGDDYLLKPEVENE